MNRRKRVMILAILLLCGLSWTWGQEEKKPILFKGTLYQDWIGIKYSGADFSSRISTRLKFTLGRRKGEGWTFYTDFRNRYSFREESSPRLMMYDFCLSYEKQESPYYFSMGQMNLYGSAGIGELLGIAGGYKPHRNLLLGGYGGYELDFYGGDLDFDTQKFGLFARYLGPGAKQFSVSMNWIRYSGETERVFIHSKALIPLNQALVLFGNIEYEIGNNLKSEDRLSRLFLNARFNLGRHFDITAHISTGRGLDFRQFLQEQSKNPSLVNDTVERYYYNGMSGLRLSYKPTKRIRLHAAWRRSHQKDKGIKNHTLRLGAAFTDLLETGVSLYGNININRGDKSESNGLSLSLSRSFGRITGYIAYSNQYNGILTASNGRFEAIHLPDRHTFSATLFMIVNRLIAVSAEYALSSQAPSNDQTFFLRLILKK